ncbi:hypothetical protein WA588_005528, partial [Blastocystis sp. NMH]
MDCLFQGSMIPLFAGAFQCFAKLNGEVTVLCSSSGLSFQVVGLALQSYMKLSIEKDAFASYKCGDPFHFAVNTKGLMNVFKDIKQIDSVMMRTEQTDIEYNIVIELLCKQKVRKVFRLHYSDATLNDASFNTESAANSVSIRPDLLCKALQYLQTTDEVIMRVYESNLSLENIPVEGEVRTISNLAASDVDHISILSPTSLRFMTTGLQAVLQFMVTADVRLAELQFGEGGSVLRLAVKPGNEREGVLMEYLLVTAMENEGLSLESHLDVTASEKRSSQYDSPVEKRVDVEENDDEFWKRRQDDDAEWL